MQDIKRSKQVFERLRGRFSDVEMFHDQTTVTIHRLLCPEDPYEEPSSWIEMMVISGSGPGKPIGDESQILSKIDREFQIARVFADVSGPNEAKRKEVEEFADKQWRILGGG